MFSYARTSTCALDTPKKLNTHTHRNNTTLIFNTPTQKRQHHREVLSKEERNVATLDGSVGVAFGLQSI